MAFLAGLFQTMSSLLIELTNLLIILSSTNEFDVVMNFMALKVIAEFPGLFMVGVEKNLINEIVSSEKYSYLYRITRTTSTITRSTAEHLDLVNEDHPFVSQQTLRVDFQSKWPKKVMRSIYKVLRLFHVTLWYYFFPSFTLILSFALPFYMNRMTSHATH